VIQRPPRKAWFDTLPDAPRNLLDWIDIQAFATYVEFIVRHREAVLTQRQLDHSNSLHHYCKAEHGHVILPYVRIIDRCIILMRVATGDGLHAVGQGTDHHG
jgi:hypothetical protein